ncbi:MAG: 6-phosphogluconolactonase [Thermodesulfobacteriota bacterium]
MKKNSPEIIVCEDTAEIAERAAKVFIELAGGFIKGHGRFTVALSGGRTPQDLYKLLSSEKYRGEIDWTGVEFFWGDERCVPPTDPESNFFNARKDLLDKLEIPEKNIHRIKGELLEAGAGEYETELENAFGLRGGEFPGFDLVILGMGADGHTASLFPHTSVLKEKKKRTAAIYVERLKTLRITLTPPVIKGAANIILLVSGREKSATLYNVLKGDFDPERLPAQITFSSEAVSTWFVDKEAARKL